MLNDSESRYPVFTLANSKEKPLSCYNAGGNRKLNSRQLKCSLESLSIPLSSTHTCTHTSTELKFDCDSVFIHNCKLFFGEFGGASYSPPRSFPTLVPIFSPCPKSCLHHSQSQAACTYGDNRQSPQQLWDRSTLSHYKTSEIHEVAQRSGAYN